MNETINKVQSALSNLYDLLDALENKRSGENEMERFIEDINYIHRNVNDPEFYK